MGFWYHQVILLWNLLLFPVDFLVASPTCAPWSVNAWQWTPEERDRQWQHESLTLQLLAVACFVETLLGRSWLVEQMAGSDLFDAYAMVPITGKDAISDHFSFIFDQCVLGAEMDEKPVKKHTRLEANSPPQSTSLLTAPNAPSALHLGSNRCRPKSTYMR